MLEYVLGKYIMSIVGFAVPHPIHLCIFQGGDLEARLCFSLFCACKLLGIAVAVRMGTEP